MKEDRAMAGMYKRLNYIDATKGVAIMMIMLGHITALSNPVDTWMSSCKIAVFYVISGFLMAHTQSLHKRTPGQFCRNLVNTIAWPYFTFSILAILAKTFFVVSKHSGIEVIVDTLKENLAVSLSLKGINSMWFLPTLCFGELIILVLFMLPKPCKMVYALIGLLGMYGTTQLGEVIGLTDYFAYTINILGKSIVAAWFIGFGYCVYLFDVV